ncbi:cell division protein ZipA [Endozoicomonas sp. G2_1]|uniref:cell division protein ZipA n=1 Tax=Endozoicomonas sp. G2_1 TaxID=2821091 RepID=UPI001ADAFA83|nr:cell division protein ZipA [Endozoicomonas sp. G2_1]MBO9491346.1 cell division protein ZipA [Endozoicomonas sp. G2_1]
MMEDTFRNALIIISAIVIGAIFVHGLWTIRKNKNPYKLKAKHDGDFEPAERTTDGAGFDQDGIGQVKVVGKNQGAEQEQSLNHGQEPLMAASGHDNAQANEQTATEQQAAPELHVETMPETPTTESVSLEQVSVDEASHIDRNEPEIGDLTQLGAAPEQDTVYQTPVTQPKPERKIAKTSATTKKAALKRNQMEIDFDDDLSFDEPTTNEAKQSAAVNTETKEQVELEQEVLVLSVVMPENQVISGAALLPSLLTLGMRFGEMNIFHRHEDNAGNGKVTFSLANMMNPGTFDLDEMESFATQGVSLFMTLPNAGDPFEVFQHMLGAAKQLAQEYHGQVLDDKRSVMTKQTEQHYISKIREFERKKRIAGA